MDLQLCAYTIACWSRSQTVHVSATLRNIHSRSQLVHMTGLLLIIACTTCTDRLIDLDYPSQPKSPCPVNQVTPFNQDTLGDPRHPRQPIYQDDPRIKSPK
ncbi:hypothetical protein DPMN_061002 [Dreissena polymorpha]|uniref:Uncharacterized protein n=1 Tax=Dreissena polymorpha TaxID=45954 RepID=A0A9D4HI26_DREPO|nr:hypothetical protein DPMN_061002 [Dreissena polymorpha]